ncbi:lipoprotein signal peptidase [Aureisphaera galaxeae]|uniref:lipoprotein signal peptidase n=1 Tax=Aureisphaera galaxeae TaxID=1538023 RepID=UPI0023510353|nr:lipoprotein signal peptidase [Aureisphaera galaxeae]MDC8002544.1 lipoprotein signal peptidase [Aureisphaera galaxeae]
MSLRKALLIVILILLADQALKIYIKTNFMLGEGFEIFSWFDINFVENPGMAWGVEIPGQYGKLALSIFRLFAIAGIGYWLFDTVRKKAPAILTFALAFIFAGAFGNIIDSVFYGVIFEDSMGQVARMFPEQGYGKWFHGKVVDMFAFSFFPPVFNIADAAISTGVGILIVFNRRAFPKKVQEEISEAPVQETEA